MTTQHSISGYTYDAPDQNETHAYLLPMVKAELNRIGLRLSVKKRVVNLGCGHGSIAGIFAAEGWDGMCVNLSDQGIDQGRRAYRHLRLDQGSAYNDLAA